MIQTEPNLYEILLRNLKEAVVFSDVQGRIQFFNPIAEKYFKVREKKVLGKKLTRAIPYRNIRRHFDFVYEKKENNHDVELAVHVFPTPSGDREARILQCNFYPIFDRKETFLGCLAP